METLGIGNLIPVSAGGGIERESRLSHHLLGGCFPSGTQLKQIYEQCPTLSRGR